MKKREIIIPPPPPYNHKGFGHFVRKNNPAFTLAEVLITLTIIGVIAALTVPTLTKKYNDHVTVTRLKKAYNVLSNASKMAESENGHFLQWGVNASSLAVPNNLKPYLKIKKICAPKEQGCWVKTKAFDESLGDAYEANEFGFGSVKMPSFMLEDGTHLTFWNWQQANNFGLAAFGVRIPSSNFFTAILVDINGAGEPNRYGYDVFAFVLSEIGLLPAGCHQDWSYQSDQGRLFFKTYKVLKGGKNW